MKKQRQAAPKPLNQVQCYKCRKFGHYSNHCPGQNKQQVQCYKCRAFGHYSNNCPKEKENNNQEANCVVCMIAPKTELLKPCNHICTCAACSGALLVCPICRAPIQSREKVFIA